MKAFIKQRTVQEPVKVEPEIKYVDEPKKVVKRDKTTDVLEHMQKNGSITSMEAFELYGATRLSAIIFNLRKKGYDIETEDARCTDRYGHVCNFAKYVLND